MNVSVITTLYNYAQYIEDNIKSFLNQKFEGAELIIVDDASTDNSYNIIKKYESNEVRYIRIDENKGYSYAKNIGIKNARSEVIAMLDADDMLSENSLEVRYNKINEGYDFVHGKCCDLVNGKMRDNYISNTMWGKWIKNNSYLHVHAQGVMLRKKIHREIGLYDETLRFKSDREFFGRVFSYNYKIGFVSNIVAVYRLHSGQMHCSREKMKINDSLKQQVFQKIERRKTDLSDVNFLE